MKTQLCQKLVVLFLISVFVSGCNIGTKKTTDNDVTFDSISVDKTEHRRHHGRRRRFDDVFHIKTGTRSE